MRRSRWTAVSAAILSLALASACGSTSRTSGPRAGSVASPSASYSAAARHGGVSEACSKTAVAAGDIVNVVSIADQTGRLAAAQQPDEVLVLGDGQYETGSLDAYRGEYDHTAWGRLKSITKPVPGNHEYLTPGAAGYFNYFGNPAPYYAYDAGCGWRGYALNSEISLAAQVDWLRKDLEAHPGAPVLAYWHRPRWSSGTHHGSDSAMQPFWTALAGRRGVVLNGHEHNYERFAAVGGLREFVVGTGGSSTYGFGAPVAGSEVRISHTPGVLRLALKGDASYDWTFLNLSRAALDHGVG